MTSAGTSTKFFGFALCGIIVLGILAWTYYKSTKEDRDCARMQYMYPDFAALKSSNSSDLIHKFYVKTAYNCCCPSRSYTHTYVNTCALKSCLRQGVRCLDFQIYSYDNEPVIAVSAVNENTTKGTYNHIPFSKAMRVIKDLGFNATGTPCYDDPLFLNLRVMSENPDIYKKMAVVLADTLGSRLTVTGIGTDIGEQPLRDYRGKAVVMLDPSHLELTTASDLAEMVDLPAEGKNNMQSFRYHELKSVTNKSELIEFNEYDSTAVKKGLSICLPDLGANPKNPSFETIREYKCHFPAMCFQLPDDNLKKYNEIFDTYGTAFILQSSVDAAS